MESPGSQPRLGLATEHGRIPSLDGLRAVSISMVLLAHGLGSMPHWMQRWPRLLGFLANGNRGVSVFFVISGFLITSLLLRERAKTGSVSLRNFYLRRFFRIVPPFYTYLLCLLLLGGVGFLVVHPTSFLSAAFFVKDYVGEGEWWTGHSWSLSIEEQFYLLWPAALVLLRPERARKVALGIVFAAPVIRVISHALLHHLGPAEEFMFHVRMDGLMLGCLLALYEGTPLLEKVVARSGFLSVAGIAFLALGAPYLSMRCGGWYTFPFGYSVEYCVIAVVLLYVVRNPSARVAAVLNNRLVVHVGVISYSLYLWQQLFLTGLNRTWTGAVPFSFLCCFAAAELSWRLVERPALRMRARLEREPRSCREVETICAVS